jgi:hypothetical protein
MGADFLLMTPTAHLPVHGLPYAASILKPFLTTHGTSWLSDASAPHTCGVAGCALMRANVRSLWARVARLVARRAMRRFVGRLALARALPTDLASHVLAFV